MINIEPNSSLPNPRYSFIFGLDLVVLIFYGKYQFAQVSYNPKTGTVLFIEVCFFKVHILLSIVRSRIQLRGDSRFFNKKVIERLERGGKISILSPVLFITDSNSKRLSKESEVSIFPEFMNLQQINFLRCSIFESFLSKFALFMHFYVHRSRGTRRIEMV